MHRSLSFFYGVLGLVMVTGTQLQTTRACALSNPNTMKYKLESAQLKADLSEKGIVSLQDRQGHLLCDAPRIPTHNIRRVDDPEKGQAKSEASMSDGVVSCKDQFLSPSGTVADQIRTDYSINRKSGEMMIHQLGQGDQPGMVGVEWKLGAVPAEFNMIIPGWTGIRLTRTSAITHILFDYPLPWEAQLIIFERDGYGFYVWSDDTEGHFKRLAVHLGDNG